ncbi:MAG TPA: hypothetical protein VE153_35560 [Myxococcus sp.]|nr:hypothetical protein [Myxococcus sp.]
MKAPLSPEQAIERLLGSNHGTSELASPELRQLGEEVRRNPLAATAREDPVVQARLRKLLEAPPNPVTEQHLRRFFEAP